MIFAKEVDPENPDKMTKDEFNAWFWGSQLSTEEVILEYLKNIKNKNGAPSCQLELYFVYKKELCNVATLYKALGRLVRLGGLVKEQQSGLVFYKLKRG